MVPEQLATPPTSDDAPVKRIRGTEQHRLAIIVIIALAMVLWTGLAYGMFSEGRIEAPVALFATLWFGSCIATALFLPPRHGRPLSEYETTETMGLANQGAPQTLYSVQMSPFNKVRIVYGFLSYLQMQCSIFILGSLVYGITLIGSGAPSGKSEKSAVSSILGVASIIALVGLIWTQFTEKFVILAQMLSIFLPIAASRDAARVLHVDTGLAIGMSVVAAISGYILGKDYYVRATCLVSFAAAGALTFVATSWDNLVDPASSGPYARVCYNLAIFCVTALVIASRTKRLTIAGVAVAAVGLALTLSLVPSTGNVSMPTWGATLALAIIFACWVSFYDLIQYSVLLKAYIDSQGPDYGQTPSGSYMIAVFMKNKHFT